MTEAIGIGMADVVRVVLALALVSLLTLGLGKLARRRLQGGAAARLKVAERVTLGRNAQLLIVQTGSRELLVGVSEHGVQLVTELDPLQTAAPDGVGEEDAAASPASGRLGPFARLLSGKLRAGEELP